MSAQASGCSVRGLARKLRKNRPYYQANICVETLNLVSREFMELSKALDALVVLTAVKQRIVAGRPKAKEEEESTEKGGRCTLAWEGEDFEKCVRAAIPEVLLEHGANAAEMGLGFHVMMSMRFWIRPPLHTPHRRCLDDALRDWQMLADFRMSRKARHVQQQEELEGRWRAFREAYLDILAQHGQCRKRSAARLDSLEAAAKPYRERQLERWNRKAMACEDRWRHRSWREVAVLRAAERTAAKAAQAERRRLLAERRAEARRRSEEQARNRAIAREEAQARAKSRSEFQEAKAVRHVVRLLVRWQRVRKRRDRRKAGQAKKAARMAQQEARTAHAAKVASERAAREAASTARREQRLQKAERQAHWRWMMRRDMTMDELVSGTAAAWSKKKRAVSQPTSLLSTG
eukprot:gnl/TRDRNA2_/TRDRNA2_169134_c0_seq1.p1 gnl/TRDRNA2_/TRDRNA2_169134_c0~~gnl/TRDRNA2_/TRDRNA2_169134_c0_seq1.p1  ORF type:complete len:428 (-),score=82.09 gnl/TRDRNA2_/TRDRNA2_169134_c0_seq1:21-1235(-)